MYITRLLQGNTTLRISTEAMNEVTKYGRWYIQVEKFTYLRVQGFIGATYRLPRYPTDKVVLLESSR